MEFGAREMLRTPQFYMLWSVFFAAGVAGCKFVYVAHSEVAYAWGVEDGLIDRLVNDLDSSEVDP